MTSIAAITKLSPIEALQELIKVIEKDTNSKMVCKWALSEIAKNARILHEPMNYSGERAMKDISPSHIAFLIDSISKGTSVDIAGDLVELEACASFVENNIFESSFQTFPILWFPGMTA